MHEEIAGMEKSVLIHILQSPKMTGESQSKKLRIHGVKYHATTSFAAIAETGKPAHTFIRKLL
jgi:hypothetical protein